MAANQEIVLAVHQHVSALLKRRGTQYKGPARLRCAIVLNAILKTVKFLVFSSRSRNEIAQPIGPKGSRQVSQARPS